ncbi:hypothetical protein [Pseudoalteromonas denitrificans]|uniref:Uncharacterized protein n=1 Tax=Pseudoalteromonas denitrificans DSM 6059 TaxID=1123010 RepID=A0A1I1KYC3_9GAMM|nr:hypothetical protein [Pseudoalteromonas denitrificans]SFC65282.1 hypothetical protein SAMN02745724_02199 [Pseudoalteromonas denitrificans DSM 6059]
MTMQNDKANLPDNPTLKDVNWYKKQLNWGELPPFYHLVASSLGESEGILTHGFDTAIKRIIDKRNWNIPLLGGYLDNSGKIICENKPRLALYQVFTNRGFELQVYPLAKDLEINQYVKDNKLMEFMLWDPHSMRLILRINQLHKYIQFYFQRGDEADKALIIHAHKVVHRIVEFLKQELNIIKIDGVSIKRYYDLCEKETSVDQDELMLASLIMNEQTKKE